MACPPFLRTVNLLSQPSLIEGVLQSDMLDDSCLHHTSFESPTATLRNPSSDPLLGSAAGYSHPVDKQISRDDSVYWHPSAFGVIGRLYNCSNQKLRLTFIELTAFRAAVFGCELAKFKRQETVSTVASLLAAHLWSAAPLDQVPQLHNYTP